MKSAPLRQILLFGLIAVVAVAAIAGTLQTTADDCLTRADLIRAVEQSWHGLSLSCNETIRQNALQTHSTQQAPTTTR